MALLDEAHGISVSSRIALAGHPIHAMLVTFPIALIVATLGADIFWWLTADPFFGRVGLWTSGWGFGMGVLAAVAGTVELLAGAGIRRNPASWSHAVSAMSLLAVIGANWGWRLMHDTAAILPWGLLLSAGGLVLVAIAGWQGGRLVFEHGVGVILNDRFEVEEEPEPDLPELSETPAG
jgi:uncharacterized membrane protein